MPPMRRAHDLNRPGMHELTLGHQVARLAIRNRRNRLTRTG